MPKPRAKARGRGMGGSLPPDEASQYTSEETMKRRMIASAVLALSVSLSGCMASPSEAATVQSTVQTGAKAASKAAQYERVVIRRTNAERTQRGLKRVKRNACLDRYALKAARAIAKRGSLKHSKLTPVLRNCGGYKVGENLAYGFKTGRLTVKAWMKSPGHRRNIMTKGYRRIGVATVYKKGVPWTAQVFAYPKTNRYPGW